MRVLIILREFYSPSRPIGGAERQALKLAERLINKGVSVTIVTGQWDWGQPWRQKINGVPIHRHFTGWGMFNIKGLRKYGQYLYLLTLLVYLFKNNNKYDLVHCHSAMFGAAIAVAAGQRLQKRTLIRAMASGRWGDIKRLREGTGGSLKGSRWMLKKLKDADCVVALNKQVISELKAVGVKEEKIIHLPNGVEFEKIKPKTDYRLAHPITLTFLGRLHPQKGVDILLSAFKQVQEILPQFSWRLRIIGEGILRFQLEKMASQLDITDTLEFLGQVDNPYPLLDQSDIFILPSRSEGVSNALLEAMAHGLPCVVTDIAGNNDLITHNKNGLLVRPDDENDLTSAIISLVENQGLRKKLGQAAIVTVEKNYSLDSIANRYITLYSNLLQNEDYRPPLKSELSKMHRAEIYKRKPQ